jgi:hypothetical protein
MWTFLTGIACAIALAVGSAIGLNATMKQSTPQAFYTQYTVPLGHDVPPNETR